MNDLGGPITALAVRSEPLGDACEEDADRGEALLAVDHANPLHHTFGSRFGEGKQGATVVRRLRVRGRDGKQVRNQALNVGLAPAIAALPARNDVLHRAIEQVQKRNVCGLHSGARFLTLAKWFRQGRAASERDNPIAGVLDRSPT